MLQLLRTIRTALHYHRRWQVRCAYAHLYCIQPNSACRCHDCAQALADFIVYLHESPKPWRLPKAVPSVVGLAMPDATTETQLRLPA